MVTQNIADYIKKLGISLRVLAENTGINYATLRASLSKKPGNKRRDLKADELLEICKALDKNPMDFME